MRVNNFFDELLVVALSEQPENGFVFVFGTFLFSGQKVSSVPRTFYAIVKDMKNKSAKTPKREK